MDLKFDKMCEDTSLAEEYIKQKEVAKFLSLDKNIYDFYFNGKTCENTGKVKSLEFIASEHNLVEKLKCLANLLKTNMALFAQLEYLFRKIPIFNTETQINLLIKCINWIISIQCDTASHSDKEEVPECYHLYMCKDPYTSPLIQFINTIMVIHERSSQIKTSEETAAVCCLFVQLCSSAGFNSIIVQYTEVDDPTLRGTICMRGTLGVVTEDADVASAVDVLISSTEKVPWMLRRILVQENVYQQFKDALSWKCNLNKNSVNIITPNVTCAEVMYYNDTSFVIDPLENVDAPRVVPIEAYRTTKELLSLVNSYDLRYMSLWANSVEHINKISYGVECSAIWVNEFGIFRGPSQICETIFYNDFQFLENDEHLKQSARKWIKLSDTKRYEIINNFINDVSLLKITDKDLKQLLNDVLDKKDYNVQSFVHVDDDFVCTGIDQLIGIRYFKNLFEFDTIRSILRGNAVVIYFDIDSLTRDLVKKHGLPVAYDPGCRNQAHPYQSDYAKKVIWTPKGSVFGI